MPQNADEVKCAVCGSTSVQAVTVSRGNATKAGLIGALFGNAAGITAGQGSSIRVVCLKCGEEWQPGSADEAFQRLVMGGLTGEERAHYKHQIAKRAVDGSVKFVTPFIQIGFLFLVALALIEC